MIIYEVPSAKYQVIFKGLINWEKFSNSTWVYNNTEAYYILLVRSFLVESHSRCYQTWTDYLKEKITLLYRCLSKRV